MHVHRCNIAAECQGSRTEIIAYLPISSASDDTAEACEESDTDVDSAMEVDEELCSEPPGAVVNTAPG